MLTAQRKKYLHEYRLRNRDRLYTYFRDYYHKRLIKPTNRTHKKCNVCQKILASDKSDRCNFCAHVGANNRSWRGGISTENNKLRNTASYRRWRKSIYVRDNFTCQKCKKRGVYLIAHHIESWCSKPELRLDKDNGITLCRIDHNLFHKKYGRGNNTRQQTVDFLI
jgi:hypothetical protein